MFFKDFVSVKRQKIKRGASQTYDTPSSLKHSTVRSYAFTEQGVAMLSTVLRSETAIRVSIRIHQKNWWKESIESNQYAIYQEYKH